MAGEKVNCVADTEALCTQNVSRSLREATRAFKTFHTDGQLPRNFPVYEKVSGYHFWCMFCETHFFNFSI